ncbi:MAG: dockerin type I domain-containing protein [Chloroherpetonaceae bacterium]|nr:dockerin type I domain-containing protein [Chthonomonadaceae bacterium]MDW8207829.1 dockerin type I domain-containing protein [Chloroherpetonaceae bacterium]
MKRWLLGVALCGLGAVSQAQSVFQARPTDDIWVYANASDPAFDPVLRIWGFAGLAVAPSYPPGGEWSYGYLKWDVSAIPVPGPGQSYQVLEAVLTLTSQRATNYTLADTREHPLEARPLEPRFHELDWLFSNPNNPAPGDPRFGTGDFSRYSTTTTFPVPIDLLAGPGDFAAHFNQAVAGTRELGLALTSSMPAALLGGKFYRIFSRDDPGGRGPVLRVVYQMVCEVSGVVLLEGAQDQRQTVTLEFRPQDGSPAFQRQVPLDAAGRFLVGNVPVRAYTVGIKGDRWLRRTVRVDATPAPVPPVMVTLLAGDANNDNVVDVLDLDLLIQAFDTDASSNQWIPGADLNADGSVDVLDLDLLIRNFDQAGDA